MLKITKIFHTETAHRLAFHKGGCRNAHGHSYRWEISICGKKDDNGIIIDFSDFKNEVWKVLGQLDHAMVLHKNDPFFNVMKNIHLNSELYAIGFEPLKIVGFDDPPTAEVMAQWVFDKLQKIFLIPAQGGLGSPLQFISNVKVWETETSYAEI